MARRSPVIDGVDVHILWPDTHVPFEDKRAFDLVLQVVEFLRPSEIDLLGDFADFYEVSDHDKDPTRRDLFEDEVEAVNVRLRQIERASSDSRLVYCLGNHENRLQRFLTRKAPELFSFVNIEQLLGLTANDNNRPWKVVPYGTHHKVGRLYITHDVGYCGANAHRQSRQQYEGNVVIGHNHRLAVEYQGNVKGRAHLGASLGWLGDKGAIDYMHRAKSAAWMLGFGVAYVEHATGNVHVTPIPIIDYRCVVAGKLFDNSRKKKVAA
jgi:hypothetical protein